MMRFAPFANRRPTIVPQNEHVRNHRIYRGLGNTFWTLFLGIALALTIAPAFHHPCGSHHSSHTISSSDTMSLYGRSRWERPYGMAPQAFKDYIRACARAGINPYRISQTIGNYPLSSGFHKRDGQLTHRGRKIDYSAAIDLDTSDLNSHQIRRLCIALTREGFATFYRRGGFWKGKEHIHAVYGAVHMKPQLREQVRDFLRERRENGFRRLWWVRKFRRSNRE